MLVETLVQTVAAYNTKNRRQKEEEWKDQDEDEDGGPVEHRV